MQDTQIPRQHDETGVRMAGSQSQKGSLGSTDSCTMTQSAKVAREAKSPLFIYGYHNNQNPFSYKRVVTVVYVCTVQITKPKRKNSNGGEYTATVSQRRTIRHQGGG